MLAVFVLLIALINEGAFKPQSRVELKSAVNTCHLEDTSSSAETPYPSLVVFDLDGMSFSSLALVPILHLVICVFEPNMILVTMACRLHLDT